MTPTTRTFWLGLLVRLGGVAAIWIGDGHDSIVAKAVVVLGVALLIGGTTVLRFLLLSGPMSELTERLRRRRVRPRPG